MMRDATALAAAITWGVTTLASAAEVLKNKPNILDRPDWFYLKKTSLLGLPKRCFTADDVPEEHIRQYIEGKSGEEVVSWQGGG